DWKIFSWSRRLRRWPPIVVGVFGTGTPRLWDGKYLSRGTLTTLSQKGNVAHARRQDARRIVLFAARDSKLSESDFGPVAGPHRHSCGSARGEVSRDHRRTDR